jgi:hypothetical protein
VQLRRQFEAGGCGAPQRQAPQSRRRVRG